MYVLTSTLSVCPVSVAVNWVTTPTSSAVVRILLVCHALYCLETVQCSTAVNGWRCSVVVSVLASINEVNRHWARLVLEWVTAYGAGKPSGV